MLSIPNELTLQKELQKREPGIKIFRLDNRWHLFCEEEAYPVKQLVPEQRSEGDIQEEAVQNRSRDVREWIGQK